jgi:3-oxoacyl-(acyl-carrier-protein) synthase III
MNAKVRAIAYHLPDRVVTSYEIEDILRQRNPTIRIQAGIIESTTGITARRFAGGDEFNSHMAVHAARKVLEQTETSPEEIDLLIFAAAGQDLLEPATAHIVQQMLGTRCSVFDVTNACNSFVNALQVADAFIAAGQYKKILIATGETPSKSIKWDLKDRDDFKKSFAGYTLGDAGAAALIEKADTGSGILSYAGTTDSTQWEAGSLPGGGSRHPRGDEYSYFQGDGAALKEAFEKIGPDFLREFLNKQQVTVDQIARVFIHQVSVPYLDSFTTAFGLDPAKICKTIDTHGNVAAATIPLGMSLYQQKDLLKTGDLILVVGLAGGISLEAMLMRW